MQIFLYTAITTAIIHHTMRVDPVIKDVCCISNDMVIERRKLVESQVRDQIYIVELPS